MSLVRAVAWLAVRELWISFRLITVIALFLLAGALIALLPSVGRGQPAGWYAIGLGIASMGAGALLPPRRASLFTLLLCAAFAAGALALPAARSLTPASGYFLLAEVPNDWPLGRALQSIGIGLASAALLLTAAGLALERADL